MADELIQGMGKRGDEFIIILDINRVFASAEAALRETTAKLEQRRQCPIDINEVKISTDSHHGTNSCH